MLALVVVLLFADLSFAATKSECLVMVKTKRDPKVIIKPMAQANLVFSTCLKGGWLKLLYHRDRKRYQKFVRAEQKKLAFDEIVSKASLKKCLEKFATKQFWRNELDFVLAAQSFSQLKTPQERRERSCEVFKKYILRDAPEVVNWRYAMPPRRRGEQKRAEIYGKLFGEVAKRKSLDNKALDRLKSEEGYKLCMEDKGDVPATALDELKDMIKKMVQRDRLVYFYRSDDFIDCTHSDEVKKDLGNFEAIRQRFCADEKTTFEGGDQKTKDIYLKYIHESWLKECDKDPNFDPKRLGKPMAFSKREVPKSGVPIPRVNPNPLPVIKPPKKPVTV